VPHEARWHQRLAAALVYAVIRCVAATVRFEMNDVSGLFQGAPKERIIFSVWHNRLALSLMLYRRYVGRFALDRRMAAMVSASRDGGLLARVLKHFGVEPVRGSSSRRGPRALRELASWGERGDHSGRPARSALPGAGRRDFHRPVDRPADRASVLSLELENPVEKLGPLSSAAAVCPMQRPHGGGFARAARRERGGSRNAAAKA